ncbi:uncharacterized protein zgc:193811 [Erpetoichthys calabaricus]|uniref:uncharacterized protein zgc:193811 n=1 Tax=Erpetoichthys calabaricus TaxID=27687 RepID=UPI0010A0C154|nr:uncharacterized protein zgc:193811 [Erpetoichthys calabaricus]
MVSSSQAPPIGTMENMHKTDRVASLVGASLPPQLQKTLLASSAVKELQYATTALSEHNRKFSAPPFSNPRYLKPRANWLLNSLGEPSGKLKSSRISMSETKHKFRGEWEPLYFSKIRQKDLQDLSSQIEKKRSEFQMLTGEPIHISGQGIRRLSEPHLSTTSRDYCYYYRSELAPLVDLTQWKMDNMLQKIPPQASSVCLPRLAPRCCHIPHKSFLPLSCESYAWQTSQPHLQAASYPVGVLSGPPVGAAFPEIMKIPKMYKTENEEYGSKKPITM